MQNRNSISEELIGLFENQPTIVLYKDDLLFIEQKKKIAELTADNNLNPIDVVLESLINILCEKISIDKVTRSTNAVLINRTTQEEAVQIIFSIIKEDELFLQKIHDRWLSRLRDFIVESYNRGTLNFSELMFQISMKFRINASSSLKAINVIT